jgi:DNA-binding transcriptional LysR family regulator
MTSSHTDELPDLRRLQSLIFLAEEQHFGRAAKRLGISQPSLSSQIRLLEEYLDVILFVRDSRNVRLTTEGEAIVAEAKTLLTHARAADNSMRSDVSYGAPVPVRGGGDFFCPLQITPAIVAANRQLSGTEFTVRMRTDSDADSVRAVRRGELDFAVCWQMSTPLYDGLGWITLIDPDLGLVCADPHPLAARSSISLEELSRTVMTASTLDNGDFGRDLDNAFLAAGHSPIKFVLGTAPSASVTDILAGKAVVFASRLHLPKGDSPFKFVTACNPPISTQFGFVLREGLPQSTTNHLRNIAAVARSILEEPT